ncbi:hypothetical protein BGW42_008005, partial [Actinomortierella wolfii]
NFNWFTALTNSTNLSSGSAWMGVRLNDTAIVTSIRDYLLGQAPTSTPLLSVGTYTNTARPPVVGHFIVFENDGKSGTVYTCSSSASELGGVDRVQTLSNPQPVDMGDIVLSQNAYSVTQGSTGFVIDKAASDGTTILYKISPGAGSNKLTPVTPKDVPPFWANRAVTSLGTKLVFFGGLQGGTPTSTFHVYDSVNDQWSGPGLVEYKPPSGGSGNGGNGGNGGNDGNGGYGGDSGSGGSNTGAIIGGVVGGIVLLALIGFFFFRYKKNKRTDPSTPTSTPNTNNMSQVPPPVPPHGYPDGTKVPPPDMVHPPYTVPSTPQQYQQPPGVIPPTHDASNPYSQYGMAAIPAPQKSGQGEQPIIFQPQYQAQPHHSYQPPILTSVEQSQPQIFQPAVAASSATSPVPSNVAYSPTVYSSATTPHSQAAIAPHQPAGSPQYIQPPDQGYRA